MADLHLWMQAYSDQGEKMLVRVEGAERIDRNTLAVDCTEEFRAIETSLYQVLPRIQQVQGHQGFEAWHLIVDVLK